MLGPWIAAAAKWGADEKEKALYEMNAKDLITLWGNANSPLHEYACRQWSGLMNDFYKPRWQQFFAAVTNAMQQQKEMDTATFQKEIAQWEWKWVNRRKGYPLVTTGNAVETAKLMHKKYRKLIEESYQQ